MKYMFLRFPDGKYKAATLSYDDGCPTDLKLAETVTKYGLKCTFNMVSTDTLTPSVIKEKILGAGHEVAVHCANHRAPGLQRPLAGIKEVLNCRLRLESDLGLIIRGMAYPDSGITRFSNGASYENIKRYLSDLGIVYSRTLGGDNNSFSLPQDFYAWMPSARHANPKTLEYIDEFAALTDDLYCARRDARLFYLWGHSYEFENDNNWDYLDEICGKLSSLKDTWFATNIEIYDYVTAYNSLIMSADETMVYNPSLLRIWFDVDGKLYDIKPGETLNIG
ncbi:MAG: polysaccharide deacetylase family protein [Clostridia bacterium]|nr:polysaccharide deacetylase family protein [Clostridia bacterium]